MNFSIEERRQILKWYYGGRSLSTVAKIFAKTYGREHSRKSFHRTIYLLQTHGCLRSDCKKCTASQNKVKPDDESEALEIMVCAAAELELSYNDIALELSISGGKVRRILRKNGYSKTYGFEKTRKEFYDVEETDNELNENETIDAKISWVQKRQIVQWYYEGYTPVEIVSLFAKAYQQTKASKAWICYVIQLFGKCGCVRDCKTCIGTILEPSDVTDDIELENALIAAQPKKRLPSLSDVTHDVGLENAAPPKKLSPSLSDVNDDVKFEITQITAHSKEPLPNLNKNSPDKIHPPHQKDIEFVVVKPTMDVFVADEMNSSKQKKRKLS